MNYDFQVENVKCDGCTNTIITKLREIDGVEEVIVNVDEQQVTVITTPDIENNLRETVSTALARLGYPETGSEESNRILTKVNSYVSCALGKVSGMSQG